MTKRRISKQQKNRIQHIQARRLARSLQIEATTKYPDSETADLGPEQEGLLIANYGVFADVEAVTGEVYRCRLRQHLGTLVTGDHVIWCMQKDKQGGVIVATTPRQSLLYRADEKKEPKPIAANIDQLIIVIAPQPKPSPLLVDSYLIAAEVTHIKSIILLNKTDLLGKDDEEWLGIDMEAFVDEYAAIGYQTLMTNTYLAHGLDQLIERLSEQTSVFVGQSGVGKSSLINSLSPQEQIPVSALSETTGFGTHTTTASTLYHLPSGGDIIDSPGIREFGLWKLAPEEIARCFVEFRPYIGHCKFHNCQHLHEPACAIQEAVADEKILERRYLSYIHLLENKNVTRM